MAVTVSKWYLDGEVERYLLQRGYKIISLREILSNYFNAPKTIKETLKKFDIPISFLYKKFAYTTEKDLQLLIKCISDSLMWLESDGKNYRYKYSWALGFVLKDGKFTMFGRRGEDLVSASSFLISNVFKKEFNYILQQNGLSSF